MSSGEAGTKEVEIKAPEETEAKPRDVFIYNPDTRGVDRLHHVVGTDNKGDAILEPLAVPSLSGKSILEVNLPAGKSYYTPIEGPLITRTAESSLKRAGIASEKPLFVKHVPPGEKDSLAVKGYEIVTP